MKEPLFGSWMTLQRLVVSKYAFFARQKLNVVFCIDDEDLFQRSGNPSEKVVKKMSFFRKFAELQLLALQHNAGLTASHPYASGPINWPFLLSGISFWTHNDTKKQIYFIGNVVGWWTCVISLSVFTGIVGADLLARRRGIAPIPECESRILSTQV